jgi:hypothetical protein
MPELTTVDIEPIARAAHEVNRAWCQMIDDTAQVAWEQAPQWQKDSAITGVNKIVNGEITEHHQSHASWMAQKEADGWVFGEVKDADAKTHPCMVPFDQLPADQRVKDYLFFTTVKNLLFAINARA